MVYRPTVRYPEAYRDFVNDVFKETSLDRNQIMRLALFTAAYSKEFQNVLEKYKMNDVPLPCPDWKLDEDDYWIHQNYIEKEETKNPPLLVNRIKVIDQGGISYVVT